MTFTTEAGSNTIEVLYDAAGTKLRKTVKPGTTVNYTQDYIAGIEYRDGAREAIYTAEGRVFYTSPTTTRYEYSIKDHLGNTRLTFTDKNANGVVDVTASPSTNEILQENHYYPFGLNTEGPWMNDASLDNRYQYNGKEWNDDFGLNWNDYGARWYDASVGRWWSVDNLSTLRNFVTPFNYSQNDPINRLDPDGLFDSRFKARWWKLWHGGGTIVNHDGIWGVIQNTRTYEVYNEKTKEYQAFTDYDFITKKGETTLSSWKPSGIEFFGHSKYGNGSLDDPQGTSDVIIDFNEFLIPAGGGITSTYGIPNLAQTINSYHEGVGTLEKPWFKPPARQLDTVCLWCKAPKGACETSKWLVWDPKTGEGVDTIENRFHDTYDYPGKAGPADDNLKKELNRKNKLKL